MPGALAYGEAWIFPGGASTNKAHIEASVKFDKKLKTWQHMMVYDPETSGGLLLPVAASLADAAVAALKAQGGDAWIVGEVRQGSGLAVVG